MTNENNETTIGEVCSTSAFGRKNGTAQVRVARIFTRPHEDENWKKTRKVEAVARIAVSTDPWVEAALGSCADSERDALLGLEKMIGEALDNCRAKNGEDSEKFTNLKSTADLLASHIHEMLVPEWEAKEAGVKPKAKPKAKPKPKPAAEPEIITVEFIVEHENDTRTKWLEVCRVRDYDSAIEIASHYSVKHACETRVSS